MAATIHRFPTEKARKPRRSLPEKMDGREYLEGPPLPLDIGDERKLLEILFDHHNQAERFLRIFDNDYFVVVAPRIKVYLPWRRCITHHLFTMLLYAGYLEETRENGLSKFILSEKGLSAAREVVSSYPHVGPEDM